MFTGIVQACKDVRRVQEQPGLKTFTLALDELTAGLDVGASISIDGVCVTVTEIETGEITVDAIEESLQRSTLGTLRPGRRVNVERSLSVGQEIGGHRVSGHVYGTAEITQVVQPENNHVVTVRVRPEWMKYIFCKGFIALDGASLTVVDVDRSTSTFTVHLIPETLRRTMLGRKCPGDRVNLEIDAQIQAIVDTVERSLAERESQGSASTPD